jgi:chemotaxis protein MotA
MKVMLTGAGDDHHLSEILDLELERHHTDGMAVPNALYKTGDAMPGFGIVATVLGVIITIGHIGGSAEEVGKSVAADLVGTFLGVLLAYGVVNPWPRLSNNVSKPRMPT